MKNIRIFYLKICHFLVIKFSVYLNRRVFVMCSVSISVTVHLPFFSLNKKKKKKNENEKSIL